MKVIEYFHELVSLGKKQIKRSLDNLFSQGDWQFLQLNNYTSASPLVVNQGNTRKITFQANNISYQTGRDLNVNYNYTLQKFTPQTLNDVFLVEIRFKAKCSSQNGHADILLEAPSTSINPVQATTFGIPRAANDEQFISVAVPVFIGPEVFTNGLEVKFSAGSGNFSVYDVSFLIVRLTSGL
jgi:hypothetical protein